MERQNIPVGVPTIFQGVGERPHQMNAKSSHGCIIERRGDGRTGVLQGIELASGVRDDGMEPVVPQFQGDRDRVAHTVFVPVADDVGQGLVEAQIDAIRELFVEARLASVSPDPL